LIPKDDGDARGPQLLPDRFTAAAGNWDLFCVFIEKALALCKQGGLSSLIVPNKLASADYAGAVRSLLTKDNTLLSLRDYSAVKAHHRRR
jgi:hypothetical protein